MFLCIICTISKHHLQYRPSYFFVILGVDYENQVETFVRLTVPLSCPHFFLEILIIFHFFTRHSKLIIKMCKMSMKMKVYFIIYSLKFLFPSLYLKYLTKSKKIQVFISYFLPPIKQKSCQDIFLISSIIRELIVRNRKKYIYRNESLFYYLYFLLVWLIPNFHQNLWNSSFYVILPDPPL